MKMSLVSALLILAGTNSAFAGLSQREADIAKQRISRCQYSDSVCVGQALVDAMVSATDGDGRGNGGYNGGGQLPPPPPRSPVGQQQLITVYGQSDQCSGTVVASVVFEKGNYTRNLQACDNMDSRAKTQVSWSVSIDNRCINISDTVGMSACQNAVKSAAEL